MWGQGGYSTSELQKFLGAYRKLKYPTLKRKWHRIYTGGTLKK